ncbi:MAG: tRNA (adenosine(37)-N6)-threonylcarbamoyltransferase complex transferase subunit TsaD [Candidatus Andersenbacteria bacterium RIFCSPHIGHO2_02_FULL_45_11]|uniref:tRNA N6-adenosine threonylcarbamoyltransferase n=1 Tax=Candidatus Andersenbacteria bacterium RIFCSPHIGHO2_12_FULL_45_11 TaxID=1797281 RepID=A0A1G1X2H7_9BACT|nr:MAG: tRNA (adenosine(37)-N6)-threonylcarbamoyltransferase complex transferase subunit TsaD [Candidatus Andersenbacteria bacterium RIFCSPHIGHO2_01_FULL_46_36]OGY32367.1 MAG: tRNA (adenosine(37)-N6)-threonylcarbamoyltransferase complex transferase subunit TsaD [Candidatus Andersenbacteria bacterium RIFCSPHIGHO2_02_FULL_45_11]OGY34216.1 MAG: tRNA (adenosine(37)-N6)-threonylcarbamoyltransferase complex transferase subunit TsaD [Candidatus Andersenbacteria bacterium RIFCSPHIGHO2_12_FULL_45_11]
MKPCTLLAIESSCDETGVSVVRKEGDGITVLSELVTSQASIHEVTGGVIPEVAAREHLNVIGPMITSALHQAECTKDDIDAIAVTVGPGLMPALVVGVQAARTLAFAWDKPLVPVHHIEGHIYSALLAANTPTPSSSPSGRGRELFPALALIVSGGHTMLIEIPSHLTYKILGETLDDAIGEVFDKVARMLGLPYPGGVHVSRLAAEGNAKAFNFPRPMLHSKDCNFSYSGLKTAVLYQVQELGEEMTENQKADIAASFQAAVVDSLAKKLVQATEGREYKAILLAGGVAANQALQSRIQKEADTLQIPLLLAPATLCGDNATMIGQAGIFAYEAGRIKSWREVDAIARVSIENFSL